MTAGGGTRRCCENTDRGVFAGERGCDENGAGEIRGVEQSVERGVRERGNGGGSIDDEGRRRDFVLFGSAMDVDAERAVEYGLNDAVVIARSEPVTIEDAMAPVWPRVTLPPAWRGSTARGASARVAWQSGRNASHGATLVYRVKGADAPFTRAPASTVTYVAKDLCAEPANGFGYRHPGYVHSADIVSVDAGDVVEYRVADEHGESELYEMVMPPAEGANTKTTLALFADMGRGSDDDAETWRAYGRPALNVSAALAADAEVK